MLRYLLSCILFSLNVGSLPTFQQGTFHEKSTFNDSSSLRTKFQSTSLPPVAFKHKVIETFQEYVTAFNVSFQNIEEETKRKMIFEANLAKLKAHNLVHDIKQGVTKFSIFTHEEIIKHHTGAVITNEKIEMFSNLKEFQPKSRHLPVMFDWRSVDGAVTNVKNQGSCGSCWAFAATAAIETHQFLKTWNTVDLSEQEILDCTYPSFYNGCDGGWGLSAYMTNPVQFTEDSYPYTGKGDQPCRTPESDATLEVGANITGYMKVQSWNSEAMQQALVEQGPLDVSIFVADDFHSWDWNHVYRSEHCNLNWPNHEVVIVGYGEDQEGDKFWTVKNSWGKGWGLDGYFHIARGVNMCSIEMLPIFPLIPDTSDFIQSPGPTTCTGEDLSSFLASSQQSCQMACSREPLCTSWSLQTSDHYCRLKSGTCSSCQGHRCKEGLFISGIKEL